jgi:hypothetical protein
VHKGARGCENCSINSLRSGSRTPPFHQQNTTSEALRICTATPQASLCNTLHVLQVSIPHSRLCIAVPQKWLLISVASRFLTYLPHHRKFVVMAGDKGTAGASVIAKDGTVMNQGDVEFLIACIQHTTGGQLIVSKNSSSSPQIRTPSASSSFPASLASSALHNSLFRELY